MYPRSSHRLRKAAPSRERSESAESYDDQRIAWARGLTEMNLRALAVEFYRGARDECAIDAYEEYRRRFPDEAKDGQAYISTKAQRPSASGSRRNAQQS